MALQQQAGNKNLNPMQIPPNVAVSKTGVGNVSGDPNMVVSLGMANANSMQSSMSNVMPGINSGASGGEWCFGSVQLKIVSVELHNTSVIFLRISKNFRYDGGECWWHQFNEWNGRWWTSREQFK